MSHFRYALVALASAALGACASEYHLMTAPGVTVVPAGDGCSFEVSRGLPAATDFVEIGRLEAQFFPASDLEKLRATTKDEVCSIGGDLLVGEWDGDHFMSAVVYRRRAAPLSLPPPPKSSPSASAP